MMADKSPPFSPLPCETEIMTTGNEDIKDETKCRETALEKMLCGAEFL